jgi:hypothetical protein
MDIDRKETISQNTMINWIVTALSVCVLAVVCWVANKASDIPVIQVQMEYITKQLDHINGAQDSSAISIEEGKNKLADHERRIQTLEAEKNDLRRSRP